MAWLGFGKPDVLHENRGGEAVFHLKALVIAPTPLFRQMKRMMHRLAYYQLNRLHVGGDLW